MKKRMSTQKKARQMKRDKDRLLTSALPILTALLIVATFGHKADIHAGSRTAKGALFGGLTGAAIGGAAGGGKGAGIGAAVGLGVGAAAGAASEDYYGDSPYEDIDKLKRKRSKLERKAAKTKSESRRARYYREIDVLNQQIAQMEASLGIRQGQYQPAPGMQQQQPRYQTAPGMMGQRRPIGGGYYGDY